MAVPYVFDGSNLTASLADNTSGTTFAAKARAAELNAVRSRKASKDMETEEEVPSVAPVALGALKFNRPRNRGRGWKALNLGELPEESPQGDEAFGKSTHGAGFYNPPFINYQNFRTGQSLIHENIANSRISYRPTIDPAVSYQESMDAPGPHGLEKMDENTSLNKENGETSPVGHFPKIVLMI